MVKRRSGSEVRQRTHSVSLRLLPAEGAALRAIAKEQGHSSVQSLILQMLQPLLEDHPRKH